MRRTSRRFSDLQGIAWVPILCVVTWGLAFLFGWLVGVYS